ncbi:MAG: DMT family transporter [Candidatus Magasanikbacteria bacterium]
MWFFIAIIGYLLLAVVFVMDKYILSEQKQKPVVYTFYSTIILLVVFLAYPFGVDILHGIDWFWALVSGVTFGLALYTTYTALDIGEASHISPFAGAFVTIFTYILSSFVLSEKLSSLQLFGLFVLVLATFLFSFEKSKKFKGFHVGFLWAILAGFFFAVSHVSAKYLYDTYDFLSGFVWTRASTGFVGLILLLSPIVRKTFKKKRKKVKISFAGVFAIDKLLGALGVIAIQYAISIGSVTLVNAMVGVQYVLMFIIILLLTKFSPRVFKEYFTRREIAIEILALVLVVVGSAMFVL